jgi:hypothetical protein
VKSSCDTSYLGSFSVQEPFYLIHSPFSQLQMRHPVVGGMNIPSLWDAVLVQIHEFDDICCG